MGTKKTKAKSKGKSVKPPPAKALPDMKRPVAPPSNVVPLRLPRNGGRQIVVDPKTMVKLEKKIGSEVVGALRAMSADELRARLATLAEHEIETEQALAADSDVKELKEQLKNAQGPYKETLRGVKFQRQLAVLFLQERGRGVKPVPAETAAAAE